MVRVKSLVEGVGRQVQLAFSKLGLDPNHSPSYPLDHHLFSLAHFDLVRVHPPVFQAFFLPAHNSLHPSLHLDLNRTLSDMLENPCLHHQLLPSVPSPPFTLLLS